MLLLPNGCRCSNPSVFPKDWKTVKSITCDWKIQYYFYDPNRPKPTTPIVVKGMNEFKNLRDRRAATKLILEEQLELLQNEGYNPYTKLSFVNNIANTNMRFMPALRYAFEKIKIAKDTRSDMKSMLKYFEAAAVASGLAQVPISEIKRRHVKTVLLMAQEMRNLSACRYNKYKDYISSLLTWLEEDEIIESNFILKMKKQEVVQKIREQLTPEQCVEVDEHLKKKVYSFWRFTHIFFQSGGRIIELMRVQAKDVNLQKQEYKVTINKGKKRKEVIRVINNEILPLWKDIMEHCMHTNDYIFSEGLRPGPKMIRREQVTRRWEVHVKGPREKGGLGITADFYSLKHLFLDRAAANYDITTSQHLADHTTPVVTMKHYATGHKNRELEKKKKVKISFAGSL